MGEVKIKTEKELLIMKEGGERLRRIKEELFDMVAEGVRIEEVEDKATDLIKKAKGKPSFRMVDGYSWSTCINVNDGVVHGIPKDKKFMDGDLVSVDIGMHYDGFHTDTSFTKLIGHDLSKEKFLKAGRQALAAGIKQVKAGKRIGDISAAIEKEIVGRGYNPIRDLTGHGVGAALHEAPLIPCFVSDSVEARVEIRPGMALAVEVMYAQGTPSVFVEDDGWTIRTRDGKLSALFEETVAVFPGGARVLT